MEQLQLRKYIRINSTEEELFKECRKIYEESFPVEEQRSIDDQARIFRQFDNYHFHAITDPSLSSEKGGVVGFITYWVFSEVVYGEHLAIDPALRGKDIGGDAIEFLKQQCRQMKMPLILEIELPTDPLKKRREQFYIRHSFVTNGIKHFQPPYHKGFEPLELLIMSYPGPIGNDTYNRFYPEYKAMMPKL